MADLEVGEHEEHPGLRSIAVSARPQAAGLWFLPFRLPGLWPQHSSLGLPFPWPALCMFV